MFDPLCRPILAHDASRWLTAAETDSFASVVLLREPLTLPSLQMGGSVVYE